MDTKSLIKTIGSLEAISSTEKDGLINDLQTTGLTEELKKSIGDLLESELDAMNVKLEENLKKEPELYQEYKNEEKDVKFGLLAQEMENQIQASEDQFNKQMGAVEEAADKIEEEAVRQRIQEA